MGEATAGQDRTLPRPLTQLPPPTTGGHAESVPCVESTHMDPATVSLREAVARVGVKVSRFKTAYQHLFTDARPPHLRGTSSPRLFYRVELDIACEPGGWEKLAQRQAEASGGRRWGGSR